MPTDAESRTYLRKCEATIAASRDLATYCHGQARRATASLLSLGYEPYCDTRSHVVSELVEEVWLMLET